ncbi:hypothetical protein LO762_25500 [Actinocorallia sp. API 0066]|uniref:hypothetical protein n=1 Tax=Actinocorallia sp. API 0066 TaxID=2896846 RepID=UPI001E3E9FBB|nr:hypothetical protein [Actinocorallia sp. API 0066]MCD0452515.1 hypothetical protein [Actinocorallia sp. API 0066]
MTRWRVKCRDAATAGRLLLLALVAALVPLVALPAPAAAETQGGAPVIVLGVPGLQWDDLSAGGTPTLWRLAGEHAAASLSIRTTTTRTCPIDGWLTVSAGQRARLEHGACALPPQPQAAPGGGATVPGWAEIAADNRTTSYQAKVGLLGSKIKQSGGCTRAVGAGAALGAADERGHVDGYAPLPEEVEDWSRCAVTMVDIDDVHRVYVEAGVDEDGEQVEPAPLDRADAAAAADTRIAAILGRLPAHATVLVAGLADTTGDPHLHVAIASGPGFAPGYLTSSSTRRRGLVTLTDLSSTVLSVLGLQQPSGMVGASWTAAPSPDAAAQKADVLHDEDVAAQAIRDLSGAFFVVLLAAQLLLYGFAAFALRRRAFDRRRVLALTRVVALGGAAAPVATYLANLVPWWRSDHPVVSLAVCVATATALVTGLALAGPWRRSLTGSGLVIAAITVAVLGIDVVTGSHLQLNAFMGYTALVAGRFYGFGNMAFALFATAAMLTAAWLAEPLVRKGRRGLAAALVVVIGLGAMIVDGMPGWGSDFGGVIAILLGTAVLALQVGGQRVSAVRVALAGALGAAVVLGLAFLDSRRADPTHLGKFWEQLAAGEAWGVVTRKTGAMLRSFGGYLPFTLMAISALLFLFLVLARPSAWRASALGRAYEYSPTFAPSLVAVLTVTLVGMLMNDSGVVIPALVFTLAVPLVLAASVRALELDAEPGTPRPGPQEPRPAQRA